MPEPGPGESIYARLQRDQENLRRRLVIRDDFPELRYIGGADAAFSPDKRNVLGVIVVFSYPSLEVVEVRKGLVPVEFPYIPGFLSYREGPVFSRIYGDVVHKPDVLIFDGQGIAHPRGLGLASHMGLALQVPTIGCAKSRLVGEYDEPGPRKGDYSPLYYKGQQVGWVLRSRDSVRPLFVSPGNRVGFESSREIVLACCRGYRLPEPVRMAHNQVTLLRNSFDTGGG